MERILAPAVAIAGMHRSGTSMIADALSRAGLFLGDEEEHVPAAPDNPRGFYEHGGFQRLNDDLLQATGGAWDHPPAAPPMAADDPRVTGLVDRGNALVEHLSAPGGPWGWKDPRTSLTIRFWLDLVPDLRIVVCLRHPLEVALSLKRRNRASYASSLNLWHVYYTTLLDAVPEDRRVVTHYDAHFEDPPGELARVAEFAGLDPSGVEPGAEASDARLRHHRLRLTLRAAGVDAATIGLYESLCAEAGMPAPEEDDGAPAPATVDRNALDLEIATVELQRRGQHIASLQRRRAELEERVAKLEAALAPAGTIGRRLRRLELTERRRRLADLERKGRPDIEALRGCHELLAEHTGPNQQVLVVGKGDPVWLDFDRVRAVNFPADASGRYPGFAFADDSAAIAHLEARRAQRARFILIPDPAAWWREHYRTFTDHLVKRYRVVWDVAGVGMLVDLRNRAGSRHSVSRDVATAVAQLAGPELRNPSVLDWSGGTAAALLRGQKVFPPPPGETLPYLSGSIDVVLVDEAALEPGGRLDEAHRVAARGIVVLRYGDSGPVVVRVVPTVEAAASDVRLRVLVPAEGALPEVRASLEEALEETPAAELLGGVARWRDVQADVAGDEVVVLVEHGVVPLPGCCEAAVATLGADPGVGAVAVKTFAPDGALDAAGTTVFSDGSAAGVGAGSHQVSAPWHEYLRGTSGGSGLLFVRASLLAGLPPDAALTDRTLTGWAAEVWRAGSSVAYQPEAWAVRLEPRRAPEADAAGWEPVLAARPRRPASLDERAWRLLLAEEDVAAGWQAAQQAA